MQRQDAHYKEQCFLCDTFYFFTFIVFPIQPSPHKKPQFLLCSPSPEVTNPNEQLFHSRNAWMRSLNKKLIQDGVMILILQHYRITGGYCQVSPITRRIKIFLML